MKQRLLLLYKLSRIDKELQELNSLKGDIPALVEDLTAKKQEIERQLNSKTSALEEILGAESSFETENSALTARIEKDDNLLRSGGVNSNEEYNALAREIEDAYAKIESNERAVDSDYKTKKISLKKDIDALQAQFDEISETLGQHEAELGELNKQNEEEVDELRKQREALLPSIPPEDMEVYNRVNNSKFGDAIAVVRKGSCLGCYSSIPPQRSIEIRTADRIFHCEACGRILIAEEILT